MIKEIKTALLEHLPLTLLGGFSGIIFLYIFKNISHEVAHTFFYIAHPAHVFLSALVTASLFALHKREETHRKPSIAAIVCIGYVGSIGIATLSDSIIPFLGEILLAMPHAEHHIGFIEKWWLITLLALLGIGLAYVRPSTKLPHAGHVGISTAASLFHILMAKGESVSFGVYILIFMFLVISVWIPCCVSDIIFPLLFIKGK